MADDDFSPAFERIRRLASEAGLPGVEEGTSYRTPALKVRGKGFLRLKDTDTLVLLLPLEEKVFLLEAAPEIYFETDHYRGWPALLVRLSAIGDEELRGRLAQAWRHKAPKTLLRELDGRG